MILKRSRGGWRTLCLLAASGLSLAQSADDARMNQIRVLGSHNSYKQRIDAPLVDLLRERIGKKVNGLEYSHIPIEAQLDRGLRGLEIDVVYDPQGGLYAHPKGLALEKEKGLETPAYDPQGLMGKPGFKVIHVPDLDFRANVYTFQQELVILKKWSDAHPHHLPISITMNAKDDGIKQPGYVQPLPFDRAAFDTWDAEILKGLGRGKLITPDDVRGSHPTLEAAVLAQDWPKLEWSRGKFLFVLDEKGKKMKTYIEGHPSLKGRVMFVNEEEGKPEAAVRIVNEPRQDWAYIQYLVRSGYLVRTRADADTVEARKGDYSRWKAALISGAQIISTDYYDPDPALNTGYHVQLPGGQPGLWDDLLLPSTRPLPDAE
ncbi:MAG: phosphatidylinositol-specific phospholipase C1-like protein [Bryobacteraceae bacterium]